MVEEEKNWGFLGEGGWERELCDLRRKVPQPSVGICLNSKGKPTHSPSLLCSPGGLAGLGVCALM